MRIQIRQLAVGFLAFGLANNLIARDPVNGGEAELIIEDEGEAPVGNGEIFISDDEIIIGEDEIIIDEPMAVYNCEFVLTANLSGYPLNVRQGPGVEFEVSDKVAENKVLKVEDYVEYEAAATGQSTIWLKVSYEKDSQVQTGWVISDYTKCNDVVDPDPLDPVTPGKCMKADFTKPFQWPVPTDKKIIFGFGEEVSYMTCGFHTGVDIGGQIGAPIVAAASGQVVHVGDMWLQGEGVGRGQNSVIVYHSNGIYTTYSHNSRALVQAGDCVNAGQTIALLGEEGYTNEPNLHFEVLEKTRFTGDWKEPFKNVCKAYVDPKIYLF